MPPKPRSPVDDPEVSEIFVAETFLPDALVCPAKGHRFDLLAIEAFFKARAGGINRWRDEASGKPAWEIVHDCGKKYGVHPKWILMKLQGEEGCIRSPEPTQEDIDWCMNAGVPDRGPRMENKKGFSVQIDFACEIIRRHFDRFQPGVVVKDVGFRLEPKNAATYANAKYTPHLEGLELLWTIGRGFERFW